MKLPALRSRRSPPDPDAQRGPTPPWQRLFRLPRGRQLRELLRRDPGTKLVALLLAIFLWYSITKTERDAERIIELPVSLRNIPDGFAVSQPPTKPVSVTLRGPRTILDNVDERKTRLQVGLKRISEPGDLRVDLNGAMLSPELPRSLKAVRFDPPSLTLRADKRTMRRLPVKPNLAGSPALGYTVTESTVAPDVIEVTGPARIVDDLKQVTTEPIELRGASESVERNVLLDRPDPALTFVPDVVRVTVTLQENLVSRDFPRVRIVVPAGVSEITPATVDLTIRGPQRLVHNLRLPPDAVTVDVADLPPGVHAGVGLQVTLPEGLKVVEQSPDRVRVKVAGEEQHQ
jgi:YbbR domain-containing protein